MQEICKSWEIRIYYDFFFKWLDFGRLEEVSTFIYIKVSVRSKSESLFCITNIGNRKSNTILRNTFSVRPVCYKWW